MLGDSYLAQLAAALRGPLIAPGNPEYDTARRVFNAMIDRHPAAIARCAGAADVMACVRFAREHSLPISVRGGGHNVAGSAVCDDGLVIDLSRMKTIRIDPQKRTARADPGLLLGEFDRETQAFGLATTLGVFSVTGIAGLTLGGGVGWLVGKHGLACDNLRSVDMVTADGSFVTASTDQNEDLFWGIRGGSGNFGVVTSLEYQLHPLGPVLAGFVAYPPTEAENVIRFFREYTDACPDELGLHLVMLTLPDGNTVVAIAGCYSGDDLSRGEQLLKPLRSFGSPLVDMFQVMPYTEFQKATDWWAVPGQHHYWKSSFLRDLPEEAVGTIVDFARRKPTSGSGFALELMHGAAKRVPPDATAFPHRDGTHNLLILGRWSPTEDREAVMQWVREFWNAVQPYLTANVYVNYLSANEGEDRVRASFGINYDRLVRLKTKYDPTNFFRVNQNIRPAAAAEAQPAA